MPLSFTIFIISVIGIVLLFTVRFFEYVKGEITSLSSLRKYADKFVIRGARVVHRSLLDAWAWIRDNGPRVIKDVYWRIRRSHIRVWVKKGLSYISKVLHDVVVFLLRLFGRMRKRFEKLYQRFSE